MAETLSQKLVAETHLRTTQFELLHSCLLDLNMKVEKLECIVTQLQVQQSDLTASDLECRVNAALGCSHKPVRFIQPYREGKAVGPDQTEVGNGLVIPDEFVVTKEHQAQIGKRMTKQAILDWLEQYPLKAKQQAA
jgi:hypothetical protein